MTTGDSEQAAHIHQILMPLQKESNSLEYLHQFKEMVEMDRRLRALEALYTGLYTQVSSLEKTIVENKR